LLPGLALIAYAAATLAGLPMALRALCAALALVSLASAWRLGRRLDLSLLGLAVLALPLTATLQFYAGYPLRVVAGHLAVVLLQSNGLAVVLDGAVLDGSVRTLGLGAENSRTGSFRVFARSRAWCGAHPISAAIILSVEPAARMRVSVVSLSVVHCHDLLLDMVRSPESRCAGCSP
jgi:hypothetical protein